MKYLPALLAAALVLQTVMLINSGNMPSSMPGAGAVFGSSIAGFALIFTALLVSIYG
jgi:hypothetical protein